MEITIERTPIDEVIVVKTQVFRDERGLFMRLSIDVTGIFVNKDPETLVYFYEERKNGYS